MNLTTILIIVIVASWIWFVIDHFFWGKISAKPYGELIFTQINEDEAKVNMRIYTNYLDKVLTSDMVVLKVIRE